MLQIEYTPEFPPELKAPAEACLREAISFLESVPRPMAKPEIEYLTPAFEKMKFLFGEDIWSHGLYSTKTMAGWCNLSYKSSGDLLFNTTPAYTIANVDPAIATTASLVYVLDQYFVVGKHEEQHLVRQLQWLDSLASTNAKAKSLLDEFEQHQQQQQEEVKAEEYQQQLELKRYLAARKRRFDTALRIPKWWLERYPDSPQATKSEFLVTVGGSPVGTHEDWRQAELTAPAPNKAVAKLSEPHKVNAVPVTAEEAIQQAVDSYRQLEANALSYSTTSSCEDFDK